MKERFGERERERERAMTFERELEREKCNFGASHRCLELSCTIGRRATPTPTGFRIQGERVSYF
jgi:hypothetical protein